jgi:hypothetical protein
MIDYLEVGPVPADEPCAQVGDMDYRNVARREMNTYARQLDRMFPDAKKYDVTFLPKFFNHDFGSYGEVCVCYDTDNEESMNFAFHVERNLPEFWDDEAVKELDDAF